MFVLHSEQVGWANQFHQEWEELELMHKLETLQSAQMGEAHVDFGAKMCTEP